MCLKYTKSTLYVLKTLLTHRVTYRFLLMLIAACGLTQSTQYINGLETIVCSIFSCDS